MFLETTVCVAYSLRPNYRFKRRRKTFVPVGNEIMTKFIGDCKQKKIEYAISEIVEDEVNVKLPTVVNRYFDRARIKVFAIRNQIYIKCRRRFLNLLRHRTKIDEPPSNFESVKKMYTNFAKNPKLREKMIRMQSQKKRKSLLPSETDMKILGQAHALTKNYRVIFVTDDGDFLNFKNEIEKKLKLEIIGLLDLPHFHEIV